MNSSSFLLCLVLFPIICTASVPEPSWTQWSSCSVTCGRGSQTRWRKTCKYPTSSCKVTKEEQRPCMFQFCPSYLSWPRIHFHGKLVLDVSTVNNNRCNYDTKQFLTASASENFGNWNPDGSGHLYFIDTKVTSICKKPGKCSTTDKIVNMKIRETEMAVIVDLDPDWQQASEIWGLTIIIPRILEAKYSRVSMRKMRKRLAGSSGDVSKSTTYKSKLSNIKWFSNHYKHMFNNATELSISFVLDQFRFDLTRGRITGTIGLTSNDDPVQTVATRVMRADGWKNRKRQTIFIIPFKHFYRPWNLLLTESKFGMHVGIMGPAVHRINPSERQRLSVFVSRFGMPSAASQVNVKSLKHIKMGPCPFHCNSTLGWPEAALSITPVGTKPFTNSTGIVVFDMYGVRSPGSPRQCGLDGQIYPLQILVRHSTKSHSYVFEEGSNEEVTGSHIDITSIPIAARVYDEVENVECPTWQDIKDIFRLYYNLYPVMWKNKIIDTNSYEDVKAKARLLKMAMFEYDMENPRFMPTQRDLSYSKRRLIWNWMKCGMKEGKSQKVKKISKNICSSKALEEEIEKLKLDIHNALFLEFAVIPPYLTAWLSIKWERGRNKEVADILKKTVNDEMRHMVLASNLLNSIGGIPIFTSHNPSYPLTPTLGGIYGLARGNVLSLGPMSIGTVKDIFSAIERPVNDRGKKLLGHIATLWKLVSETEKRTNSSPERNSRLSALLRKFLRNEESKGQKKHSVNSNKEMSGAPTSKEHITTEKIWTIRDFATSKLAQIDDEDLHTVGGFYAKIALKLAQLESCVKLRVLGEPDYDSKSNRNVTSTIFTGDTKKQMNSRHWYKRASTAESRQCAAESVSQTMGTFPPLGEAHGNEVLSASSSNMTLNDSGVCTSTPNLDKISEVIFEVTDLSSALRSIIEIVYEGEGGSSCSPFEDLMTKRLLYVVTLLSFSRNNSRSQVIKIRDNDVLDYYECLNISKWCKTLQSPWKYCYAGSTITFFEDGVWPIVSNPNHFTYVRGTLASTLNFQFSLIYSRLLRCLNKSFNGEPDHVKFCMAAMYDLTMMGKKLVSTSIQHKNNTDGQLVPTRVNACPSFAYIGLNNPFV
uniref:LOW QUALITY PROTEIN: uncharacterized protein LOC120338016 n=1 Tax=Styela clava TaxID=7725 RepID=UPI00193972B9|nr:LOW QUALITY PROTEIN: uncharacterized protein LOC120338016 [Styela clava]